MPDNYNGKKKWSWKLTIKMREESVRFVYSNPAHSYAMHLSKQADTTNTFAQKK